MARQAAPVEINTFVGGLFTDSTALTFPNNASLDEDNFVLDKSGLRKRRLGMDYEDNASIITTSQTFSFNTTLGHSTFRWDNAANDPTISLLSVQFGNEVKFFNIANTVVSSEVILTHTFDASTSSSQYSYAVVDGILSVVTGQKEITSFEYNSTGNTISASTDFLKIRDLFGISVEIAGVNLTSGNNVATRPGSLNDEHKYNLRNQSWATERVDGSAETLIDPISSFHTATSASAYPSNSDSVNKALYPDAADTGGRTKERFFADDLFANKFGTTQASKGHYIIDAMKRGTSRQTAYEQTVSEATVTLLALSGSLLADTTSGGPSVLAQYAGRNFYAGFNGALTGGDDKSPRMSSYVLYSKRIEDVEDVVRCYQDGDPTSIDEPDRLDTDGGFIRIDGAYGIKGMVNLFNSLFVIAANGVWAIEGDDKSGFTANSFSIVKITDRGTVSGGSIVESEGTIFYWSEDGIYQIQKNQVGDWVSISVTNNKIGVFYSSISIAARESVRSQYDGFAKQVRWVYNTVLDNSNKVRELVFDVNIGSFYTNSMYVPTSGILPKVVGMFTSEPTSISTVEVQVVVGTDVVTAGGEEVFINEEQSLPTPSEVQYVIVTSTDTVIKYTFGLFKDTTWTDFSTFDGTGVDAPAFMLTGYLAGGDFQRTKQAHFMTVYFNKTEDGFSIDSNNDLVATNPSSCKVQSQWNWTNDANSNRFGRVFQAYRLQRHYLPVDSSDGFDDGHTVVQTRNKIRGKGNVLSMKFSTEPGFDLQLLGWSFILSIQTEV